MSDFIIASLAVTIPDRFRGLAPCVGEYGWLNLAIIIAAVSTGFIYF